MKFLILWIGPRVSWLEQLCVTATAPVVWAYGPIEGLRHRVPANVFPEARLTGETIALHL